MAVFPPTPKTNFGTGQLVSLSALLASAAASLPATVGINQPSGNLTQGTAATITGTVSTPNAAVQVGFSTSATTPPSSFTAATVSNNTWSVALTEGTAGTYYIWAEMTANTAVQAVSAPVTVGGTTITSPPSTGTVGTVINLAGNIAPSGQALALGFSTSNTTAPTSFIGTATVTGTTWAGTITPTTAGTFYIWAIGTGGGVAISGPVTVSAGSSAITMSLISGSGNGGLVGDTFTVGTGAQANANWNTTALTHTEVIAPNIMFSGTGSGAISSATFWFDTSATNTTVPGSNTIVSAYNSGAGLSFNASNAGGIYPGNGTPGTYYGKYAIYNSSSVLLGVVVTNAITVS